MYEFESVEGDLKRTQCQKEIVLGNWYANPEKNRASDSKKKNCLDCIEVGEV